LDVLEGELDDGSMVALAEQEPNGWIVAIRFIILSTAER
jgi:hypothetical protein